MASLDICTRFHFWWCDVIASCVLSNHCKVQIVTKVGLFNRFSLYHIIVFAHAMPTAITKLMVK